MATTKPDQNGASNRMTVIRQPSALIEITEALQQSSRGGNDALTSSLLNSTFKTATAPIRYQDTDGNDKHKIVTMGVPVRNNSPDYQEELKQVGIISKKFILKIGGGNQSTIYGRDSGSI